MRTPSGRECPYFYGDYHRGRQIEECRLIDKPNQPKKWQPKYCASCPVPDIVIANSCPNMILSADIKKSLPLFKKKVYVSAYCTKAHKEVKEPKIGCGLCHDVPKNLVIGE